jgi:hypothetical protein
MFVLSGFAFYTLNKAIKKGKIGMMPYGLVISKKQNLVSFNSTVIFYVFIGAFLLIEGLLVLSFALTFSL